MYDHTGKERNLLRKTYDYVLGIGVGTGMTRGGTYVALPPGYSARMVDFRVRLFISFSRLMGPYVVVLFVVGLGLSRRRSNRQIVRC